MSCNHLKLLAIFISVLMLAGPRVLQALHLHMYIPVVLKNRFQSHTKIAGVNEMQIGNMSESSSSSGHGSKRVKVNEMRIGNMSESSSQSGHGSGMNFSTTRHQNLTATSRGAAVSLAVVVAGQVRTLRYTHCSVYKHVLNVLVKQSFSQINFFAAVEKIANGPDIQFLSDSYVFTHKQIRIFEVQPYFGEDCFASCNRHIVHTHLGKRYCDELLSQIYYRDVVADMITSFEAQHQMQHRLILLLRPDVVFIRALPSEVLSKAMKLSNVIITPRWHQFGGLNDRFMISGPRGAMYYLRMFRGMCEASSNQTFQSGNVYQMPWRYPKHPKNFENLLRRWVEGGGFEAPPDLKTFFMYRVRMGTGLVKEGDELAGGMILARKELRSCGMK
eukprot:Tamp_05906.p1 GENE.Tamp_05906~~Tamp_05906.p1  ORF type:complete len:388 (-),score=37.13 Tamp_05906:1523-2686(-)